MMRSLCIEPRTPSFSNNTTPLHSPHPSLPSPPSCFEEAEALILKWDASTSSYASVTSLFHHDKSEAHHYMNCVHQLHHLMDSLHSQNLVQAQNLIQISMKRLQKEFYQILSMNRAHLDPESLSLRSSRTSLSTSDFEETEDGSPVDEMREAGDSISEVESVSLIGAMENLRSISECMTSCGYTKECLRVYLSIRKSIISEGIYRLNFQKLSSSKILKMDWQALELKIETWLEAVGISVKTLFNGERLLADHVFGSSPSIKESCFAEIVCDGATCLFRFPELAAKTKKSPPEKIFRLLDMYSALSSLWPEIESIFSFDSTSAVRSQVLTSLARLSESVRMMFIEFESMIKKHSSRSAVDDGGVHRLTTQAMSYLSIVADYDSTLSDMFADWPSLPNSPSPSIPENFRESPNSDESPAPSTFSARIAWLILVLLCKLDAKAAHYKEASLSYLFLANNLHHVIETVRNSNLQIALGFDWMEKHEAKMKWFVTNYEKVAWGDVISALPENPNAVLSPEEAKEVFRKFNCNFEKAYRKQNSCVVADRTVRDEIIGSVSRKVVLVYREFYDMQMINLADSWRDIREFIQFTPEDVASYVSNLFFARTASTT